MKYTVDTAENGQVALDKISEGRDRYGLVLMDCQVGPLHPPRTLTLTLMAIDARLGRF